MPSVYRMTESQLQYAVIEEAHRQGWIVAHFRGMQDSRGTWRTPVAGDGKGFVDLVLASGDRRGVLFIELKGDTGRYQVSPEQKDWHATLKASGASVHIWNPDDWRSGRISAALADEAQASEA